jgi:hypothetical protein
LSDEGVHHGLRLLRNERVARVVDHNQCDAIAEFVLHFTAIGLWFERILCSLQVEERRAAAGPPLVLFHGSHGGALAVANLRMPAGEGSACPPSRGQWVTIAYSDVLHQCGKAL